MRFAVADAAAADEQRLLGLSDDLRRLSERLGFGQPPREAMHTLFEERFGIIVCLALDILRNGKADRAGIRRVGKDPERGEQRAHELLRPHNPIPVSANRTKRIICRQGQVIGLLDLLQHRIRLTTGVHVAWQDEHGDIIGCSGGCGRHHVCRAGTDG